MTRPAFYVRDNAVHWEGVARLPERQVNDLLDLFESLSDDRGARAAWLDLYAAHVAAGGVPRIVSFNIERAA